MKNRLRREESILASKDTGTIVKYRKPLNMNIGMIIFGMMALYIVVLIVLYLRSSHIVGYEVQIGSLSISKAYTGIAIRDEEIITSSYNGYVNFYLREGEKASSRDVVYSIDESGRLQQMLQNGSFGDNNFSDDDLQEFKNDIVNYSRGFDKNHFNSVYDFKYDVNGTIIKMVNFNTYENINALNSTNLNGLVNLCSMGKSGYVVYNTDGYENLTKEDITAESFNVENYEKKRVNNNDLIESGTPVCKVITDEHWSLVIQVDEERAAELEEESYALIKFVKTQDTSWASVSIDRRADGIYAILDFNNSVMTYCTDRFVDIELVTDDKQGLKIPNSSIVEKEFFMVPEEYIIKGGPNGDYGVSKEFFDEEGNIVYSFVEVNVYSIDDDRMYYVDNTNLSIGDYICKEDSTEKYAISKCGSLIGVYNINKGYADFKQITILYQNDEYSIVNSNTAYGLTVYDRIVLDAQSVNDDDFIFSQN